MSWSRRPQWSSWSDWDSPKPRRPAHGIKAQTQRGTFGATWWAGRGLAALERLVDVGRLTRGRSYARSGQVTKLDAGPSGVDARVQGSRPTPYTVSMRFRTLDDPEWNAVISALAGEALYAARLLSGEMPEQIEDAFQTAGVTLFPTNEDDLQTDCTCPDWANPCKHVAAVFYLLGERFDADPFLMFELRGRTKDQLIAALRAHRAAGGSLAATAAEPYNADGEVTAEAPEESLPLLASTASRAPGTPDVNGLSEAEAFWTFRALSNDPPNPDTPTTSTTQTEPTELTFTFDAPSVDALPIKLLGTPPFWREWPDFPTAAEQAYRAIGERALRLATDSQ